MVHINDLAIMPIEKELTKSIDYDEVIDDFASKARKKKFQ